MKYIYDICGIPTKTVRIPVTDTAKTFTSDNYTNNGKPAIAVLITCETHNIRFAFAGAVPTQGVSGLGHILFANQSMRLANGYAIRTLSFINADNGNDAVIQATFEYDN
jgi:hypothetical protein